MRHILAIFAALLLCSAPLHAQTLKSLMFNSTNGQVVANTGTNVLTFTNASVAFGNNATVITPTAILNNAGGVNFEELYLLYDGQEKLRWSESSIDISVPLAFSGTNAAPSTRANLGFSTNLNTLWTATNASNARSGVGIPLPALTNTSNVTMMRALSGSTNTNHPYSGIISIDTGGGTHELTVSNGIVVGYELQ